MDVSFEENYKRALRAQTIDCPELTAPADYGNHLFPLDFCRYGLRAFGGFAAFSSHIIFIGNHRNLNDLVEFWNIRATCRTVVFVPVADYRSFESMVRLIADEGSYPINQQVENRTDLQKSASLSEESFVEVCDWIATLEVGKLARRNWGPRFGEKIDWYVGDIHVAELVASESEEISILDDGQMTPVKLVPPPFLSDAAWHKGEFSWSIELTMSGGSRHPEFMFSFPKEPGAEKVVSRGLTALPGEARLGQHGPVLQQDLLRSNLYLTPIRTEDVLHALLRQAGLKATPSLPGQYAEQIVKKMGLLHWDCRVFKVRGVRQILDQLGNGPILTKGNMCQIVMSTKPDEYGQNWRDELYKDLVIRSGQKRPLRFGTIFDVLLEKRIIRPGFSFRCRTCFHEDWYHVSEFAEEYTCRFCFTPQRVNFASVSEWQYKADGLFQIPDSAQGSVAVILALWRLEELARIEHGHYVTSRELVATDTRREYEVDYVFVIVGGFNTKYEFVLGQATRFGDFTDDDMRKMSELADRFSQQPFLAFSTLKDRYSEADKSRFRDLTGRGYRVIALTREELDPYDLYARFDKARHKSTVNLRELSENTLELNVGQ